MWYTHTHTHPHTHTDTEILLSSKEWNVAICRNMPFHLAWWNKSKEDKYCMSSLACGI